MNFQRVRVFLCADKPIIFFVIENNITLYCNNISLIVIIDNNKSVLLNTSFVTRKKTRESGLSLDYYHNEIRTVVAITYIIIMLYTMKSW